MTSPAFLLNRVLLHFCDRRCLSHRDGRAHLDEHIVTSAGAIKIDEASGKSTGAGADGEW